MKRGNTKAGAARRGDARHHQVAAHASRSRRTETAVTMRGSGWSDRRTRLLSPSARADSPSLRNLLDVEAAFSGGRGQLEGVIIVEDRRVDVEIERDVGCEPGQQSTVHLAAAPSGHISSPPAYTFGRSTQRRRLERFAPRRRGWHDHQAHREARCGSAVLPGAGAHTPPHTIRWSWPRASAVIRSISSATVILTCRHRYPEPTGRRLPEPEARSRADRVHPGGKLPRGTWYR